MAKQRLDKTMVERGLTMTRSQAENYIRLGKVRVNDFIIKKAGFLVSESAVIKLNMEHQYVSRAALKLASIATDLKLNFKDKTVLDVGSSTGGFSEFALLNGAKLVYAVDVGSHQMNPLLAANPKIELHEKTDIRDFNLDKNQVKPDLILIDVSFISVRLILPAIIKNLTHSTTEIVVMLKPQFEAESKLLNRGVIKNEKYRRLILKDFEQWISKTMVIIFKKDSQIAGKKGNVERFYLLKLKR